ncbi:DUF397 domain-containing protein [Asanoa iriomotensis]|uniref:DUF397 domain-containing protein n=1 Tax=Asanoa iriomotensis TaxID=234613 RepID=UPI001942CDD2|nr:DUF397 domain-containing protein [Asanoa iriomotensis]
MSVHWKISSRCNVDHCVEVSLSDEGALMRDGKIASQSPVLAFSTDVWRSFIDDTKRGDFDTAARP